MRTTIWAAKSGAEGGVSVFSATTQDQFRRCIAEASRWAPNCSGWFLQLIILWYVGATDNLFDLRDRESDGDREVLDTGGVLAKGTPTVKSAHVDTE